MKYADIHIHQNYVNPAEKVDVKSLLNSMDRVGIEKIAVISAYGENLQQQETNIDIAARIIAQCPDRLYGLAWIEPAHHTPLEFLEKVICEKKFRGFKMIPNHWYPCEEKLIPYYEKIAELNVPCLFHSGILYFKTYSSKYCRPVYYEDLIRIKNFRFALAHISWPWTDECLALYGQWRAAKHSLCITSEMFIDITPGTPSFYRKEALKKLLLFNAEDGLIFGTDFKLTTHDFSYIQPEQWEKRINDDKEIFNQIGVSAETTEKIFYKNFLRFFGD
jgi:predicted TIM-barrel fold metal-dependent hydrolase